VGTTTLGLYGIVSYHIFLPHGDRVSAASIRRSRHSGAKPYPSRVHFIAIHLAVVVTNVQLPLSILSSIRPRPYIDPPMHWYDRYLILHLLMCLVFHYHSLLISLTPSAFLFPSLFFIKILHHEDVSF
jgi:hypothetical protein